MSPTELGEALHTWRDRTTPARAGLPAGGRRRAPGLRREELAHLSGISADYIIRLERGRARNPSPQIVEVLARALRLESGEREHLFRLAGLAVPGPGAVPRHITPASTASSTASATSPSPSTTRPGPSASPTPSTPHHRLAPVEPQDHRPSRRRRSHPGLRRPPGRRRPPSHHGLHRQTRHRGRRTPRPALRPGEPDTHRLRPRRRDMLPVRAAKAAGAAVRLVKSPRWRLCYGWVCDRGPLGVLAGAATWRAAVR